MGDKKVRPRAYISHHIPGRVRVKVPDAKRHPELLEKLRELIVSAPGVETVDCNPLTGSMLIHYSPRADETSPDFLSTGSGSAAPFSLDPPQPTQSGKKVRRRAGRKKEHSQAAKAIVEFFGDVDDVIRAATGDMLDLKVLLPLAAGVVGITLLPKSKTTPLWLTLMIFAFSSFLILHEPGAGGAEMAEIATGLEV